MKRMKLTWRSDALYIKVRQHWYNSLTYDKMEIGSSIRLGDNHRSQFRKWLAEQGCKIVLPEGQPTQLVFDSLGVSPGYHVFEFEREADATMFVLRYL